MIDKYVEMVDKYVGKFSLVIFALLFGYLGSLYLFVYSNIILGLFFLVICISLFIVANKVKKEYSKLEG